MARPDLICIGHFYSDFIFHHLDKVPELGEEVKTDQFMHSPGGGAAITSLTARRLGLNVGLVAILGKNTRKSDLAVFTERSINTRHCFVHPTLETGVTVSVSMPKDRFLLTYLGANRDLESLMPRDIFMYLSRARHVHFAMLPIDLTRWIALARKLERHDVTTSWDPGTNPHLRTEPGIDEFLKRITVFFVNRHEGEQWTGRKAPEAMLLELSKRVKMPVVKLGKEGSAAWQRDGVRPGAPLLPSRVRTKPREPQPKSEGLVLEPADPIHAAETTGAGDAFDGGFLAAFVRGKSLDKCLRSGNEAGAYRASGRGRGRK